MASPNLSEIITTTLEHRSKKLADNITENNMILKRLSERGKIKPVSGGRKIYEELEYAENGTFGWYSGYDTLNISPQDVFTTAEFDWKQCYAAVTINGLEELQNSGEEALIDLLEARVSNAEKSMKNGMAAALYADGTGNGGKEIGGLQLLIANDPTTGTVGNINRATWTFWRNQVYDASSDGGAAATAANIQGYMESLYLEVSRGSDHVDLILADNNYFKLYWDSLTANQRFTNEKLSGTGFDNLRFMNADVVFDGGIGGNCPANTMYFLNTDYIRLRPHKDRQFKPLGAANRYATNQDALVKLIGWAGNMTLTGAQYQGILKA
jgi:hypothetical protein